MTVKDFTERVAHYCDELQLEEDNYFYTAVNGALLEILERFPIVESVEISNDGSSKVVKMSELVSDFASFSTPAFKADEYFPGARPIVDGRTGTISFIDGSEGGYTIFYNKRVPAIDRDTEEMSIDGEREELLILGTAYRLLLIDADYNAAAHVKALYDEYAARLDTRLNYSEIPIRNITGW